MEKNVIAGLGEIGNPIYKIISKKHSSVGYDIDKNQKNNNYDKKFQKYETSFLHVCIPFSKKFHSNVLKLNKKFSPRIIVIHSTISPLTTKQLQSKLSIPVIYSATRGVHKRMSYDLKRYTKFFAMSKNVNNKKLVSREFSKLMKQCGIKTKEMTSPETLELGKIVCDTSYLGWLVNYAQLSNMIAKQYGVDYDEMWSFSEEIHKILGNRPKMFPGFIGGHCVIPNLDLIHNDTLDIIKQLNNKYSKKLKTSKQ